MKQPTRGRRVQPKPTKEWLDAAADFSLVATMAAMVDEAVEAVRPHGDHLREWLLDEAMAIRYYTDREWVRGVLKGAIADQQPDMPIAWLDERLPTRYPDQPDEDE